MEGEEYLLMAVILGFSLMRMGLLTHSMARNCTAGFSCTKS